jgi:hypothetical protein
VVNEHTHTGKTFQSCARDSGLFGLSCRHKKSPLFIKGVIKRHVPWEKYTAKMKKEKPKRKNNGGMLDKGQSK